jgi:AraC-like DNA-binding protein
LHFRKTAAHKAIAHAGLNEHSTHLAVSHVYDLAAMALGATRDAAEAAKRRGVRAARLQTIKADIRGRLGDRTLSLQSLAMRHGISPVYVRKLFEAEATSFTQFVLAERLARAHRLLRDQRFADHPIGWIAIEVSSGTSPISTAPSAAASAPHRPTCVRPRARTSTDFCNSVIHACHVSRARCSVKRCAAISGRRDQGAFGTQIMPLGVVQSAHDRPGGRTTYQVPVKAISARSSSTIRHISLCYG